MALRKGGIIMSVLYATITQDAIYLCADKLMVNMQTGEASPMPVRKVYSWSPSVAVGGTGNGTLTELIISGVHQYIQANGGVKVYTLKDIADLFCQCYYATVETQTNMPQDAYAQFVVAGKLPAGNLGLFDIFVKDDTADVELYESKAIPSTLIQAPADMTCVECNQLFQKATFNVKNKKMSKLGIMEEIHRKAIRYVSENSKYVGPKSDFIVITK